MTNYTIHTIINLQNNQSLSLRSDASPLCYAKNSLAMERPFITDTLILRREYQLYTSMHVSN
jgi:hypothetical protein